MTVVTAPVLAEATGVLTVAVVLTVLTVLTVARLETVEAATNEELGIVVDRLLTVRLRAEPAVPFGVDEFPDSLVVLGFDPESDEVSSGAADATPWPAATARPMPTVAARNPLRAARVLLRATTFR
ncbi:hypothetical protein [Mycolicibacterium sphagni]|uniref:hypothetical protein n=1 Tax=Mycolicibacterium sphagni TaxID=1786 RepID=UPI0021F35854|nr:hypothetical protein [Mycolicibacterium sphagni]MCV7179992.1 hypothetical protein [Mycolicibacterium sphagni]